MTAACLRRTGDLAVVDGVTNEDGIPSVYVARLPGGPLLRLDGTASLIWQEAVNGAEEGLAGRVAALLDVSGEGIEDDVRDFIEQLLAQGLLQRVEDGGLS